MEVEDPAAFIFDEIIADAWSAVAPNHLVNSILSISLSMTEQNISCELCDYTILIPFSYLLASGFSCSKYRAPSVGYFRP